MAARPDDRGANRQPGAPAVPLYGARWRAKRRARARVMALYGEIQPGALLGGRYRIRKQLGKGAFGVVFLAAHEVLGKADRPGLVFRDVALKLLVDTYVDATNMAEVFAEAIALEKLAASARL